MELLTHIFNFLTAVFKSGTFWAAVAAIGTVSSLYFIYKQITNTRKAAAYEFLRREDDRFRSEKMLCERSNLAKILLLSPDNYNEIDIYADQIFDYFEDLGLILRKGLAPVYFVWAMNAYYVLRYWAVLAKFIQWVREDRNDPTYYCDFEYLHQRILKFEKKMTGKKKIEFTPNQLHKFLMEELKEEELKLRVQARPFLLSDLDRIIEIEESSFSKAKAYPRSKFVELHKEHPEGFLVADILGEVVGYIIGYISDKIGEIDSVAVDPTFRHLGIGRKLTDFILEEFRERGIKTCSLEVSTTNEPAIHFYESTGFQIVKTLKGYYSDNSDAYLMRMNI